jgi:flagellar hook capping protein FlgD
MSARRSDARAWPGAGAIATLALALAAALAAARAAPARAQSVDVAVEPAVNTVAPGDTVYVELDVTKAGLAFNGFDAVIAYDPAALAFLPTSPLTLQEGASMKGACGSTFHHFTAAGDSLSISDVLLCGGTTLTGPGQLYKLRFRALTTPQATWIRIRSVQFYDAGAFVNPDSAHDAVVAIGVTLATPPGCATRPALRVLPNPAHGATAIEVATALAGEQQLDVLDPSGRLVRRLARGAFAPGTRRVAWNGADERGVPVEPGIYLVRLRAGGAITHTRIVVLR